MDDKNFIRQLETHQKELTQLIHRRLPILNMTLTIPISVNIQKPSIFCITRSKLAKRNIGQTLRCTKIMEKSYTQSKRKSQMI